MVSGHSGRRDSLPRDRGSGQPNTDGMFNVKGQERRGQRVSQVADVNEVLAVQALIRTNEFFLLFNRPFTLNTAKTISYTKITGKI